MRREQRGETELFQIEIKNWSAHAIGGKRLASDASLEAHSKTSTHYWSRIWDEENNTFRENSVRKVLTRMELPSSYRDLKAEVMPLVCFWRYVTNPQDQRPDPLFEFEIDDSTASEFRRFKIFSVSNYLRSLGPDDKNLEIEMPQTDQRITWMRDMLGSPL